MIPPCPTYQSINHAAPIRSPVRERTVFFRIEGLRALTSFPSPTPLPRPFCSRPIFLASRRENSFSRPDISFGSYWNAGYAGNSTCGLVVSNVARVWKPDETLALLLETVRGNSVLVTAHFCVKFGQGKP